MIMSASESRRKAEDLVVVVKTFQGVSNFRYLRNLIDNENKISSCVMDQIQAGNKAFYASLHLLKSRLISRTSKTQIYKTLIPPVVTYGAETWTLTSKDERTLRIFERKILRKIYGPIIEKGEYRIRYNEEVKKCINGENK